MEDSGEQQWYEHELEKIRTEGDVALVRAQAERQRLADTDAQLKDLQRQLKEKKKKFAQLAGSAGPRVVGDSAMIEQQSRREEHARSQLEGRLKAAVSAKNVELHKLRQHIDEQRRHRLDGLASEGRIADATLKTEETIKQSQMEMEALKNRAAQLRSEIAQVQNEFDYEKRSFRLERQQLQLDLDRVVRPEKVAVKVRVLGRKFTVFRSSAMTRKKRDALSRAKKLSLEQKVVSFEQKKLLMDRLIHESGVSTLNDFIQLYNEQEEHKAKIMGRIEVKSFANSSIKEAIAHLEEDITRLSGAGDIQSIVHMEQPNDIKRKIEADEHLMHQWTTETLAFQDTVKTFRDPIRDLHGDLFPQDREEETFETTANEITLLRRIGAIEERMMQRVLMKILKEAESAHPTTETLRRLQRHRGSLKQKDANTGLTEASSRLKREVDAPSLLELYSFHDLGEDDDQDFLFDDIPVPAFRSDDCRS